MQSEYYAGNAEGRSMATRKTAWIVGLTLMGSAVSVSAMAEGPLFGLYNPLGVYVGAGVGRATINQTQFDQFSDSFHHDDGEPVGWNAVIGLRPIPVFGAEAEYIDFGHSHLGPGFPYSAGGTTQQFLGGDVHDQAAALFAVGYLPLPIPWMEPFAKLGWAQIWDHSHFESATLVNGSDINQVTATESTHTSGTAYGGGIQFHFSQLAVRAQYERISGSRSFGEWNNPALVSVGLNWTF
jgi:opacity protein-like surface antigen